ncbi:Uncharacterised protein [uncultured archaeon]|nr:Uncharacterised protein [uncultured archaeon]
MQKELRVHGQRWASIFDGCFSDPEVARPLVETVVRAIERIYRPAREVFLCSEDGFVAWLHYGIFNCERR